MKTAKIEQAAYWVNCPYCDEALSSPETDSELFVLGEILPETLECYSCGEMSKTPKKLL